MRYEELIGEHAPKWPFPVSYGKENEVDCDVLVLGGGIAGCWAAIGASRQGARVVMVEKAATKTSGCGGSGVDHWHAAVTNPACKITPEEYSQATIDYLEGWRNGIAQYITCRDSWECLSELEKMGVKIRDSEDEFKGAAFRDEKTKLMFAYDYTAKCSIRVWGANGKPALYKECRRLGVKIYDHIMVTSLLNKGGKAGGAVIGATGLNVRTGEFYIFKGKASVLAMSNVGRNWVFSTELRGMGPGIQPGNQSGDGHVIAWKAGAEFAGLEASSSHVVGCAYGYPQYGAGDSGNTWYACSLVDANGKEIPWVDKDGRILKSVAERYLPSPGQKFFITHRGRTKEYRMPSLVPDWQQRVKKGEFTLPIYADLTSMPEEERKVIWGMMIAQEARTLIPIYRVYNQAGFDPAKDMLQYYDGGWFGVGPPQWRSSSGSGLVVDWDLKTSLDGLYAAGGQIFANGDHAYAACTGRWAGRKAAVYAKGGADSLIDRKQIDLEKARVYAPLQGHDGMDWKELNAGVCKVMQDYCGAEKSEGVLKLGLKWLDELEIGEAASTYARNPHELLRLLEVFNIMTVNRMILEACRARQASCTNLEFKRLDFPAIDPPEWRKWVTLKLVDGKVSSGSLPLDFYGNMKNSYEAHCRL